MHPGHCGGCLRPDWGFGLSGQRKCSMVLRERVTRMALEARADPARRNGAIERVGGQLGGNPEALRTWVRAEEQGGRNERGDVTRGAAPVTGRCTRYVALHPIRTGAMPTDRVYRARRQECVWNLESHNAKERGLNAPIHNPGLGRPIKGRHDAGRCTRCVALYPLRGAAPVTWRYTRSDRVQCLRIGCNAYRSGVPRSQTRTREEPGISQRERKRPQYPYTKPGTWQACDSP